MTEKDDAGAVTHETEAVTEVYSDQEIEQAISEEEVEQSLLEWDRFQIEKLLGIGGMGRVFKAWDPRLERHVAIKVLNRTDPQRARRFLREARSQARVSHEYLCPIYEVGEVSGRPYIAMQFIDGPNLAEAAADLHLETKVILIAKVALALHEAHRNGLIHRDLKPSNIMLERGEQGEWKPFVVDFGLVRDMGGEQMTEMGAVLGTPAYMAPEQANYDSKQIDRRTDVYGLGALLYSLMSGRPPFEGDSAVTTMLKVLNEEPADLRKLVPEIPHDLATIVMKCLEKPPHRRYSSARALAEDLERYLNGEAISARPASLIYRWGKKLRRNRTVTVVAVLGILASAFLMAMWLEARWSASVQADLALRFGQKVERVESGMWRSHVLKLHDLGPTKEHFRTRLEEMTMEIEKLGHLAEGPGNAALGRAYVALQDYGRARKHLEIAWEAGQRDPEVAFALGVSLGELYQREKGVAEHIGDEEGRKSRLSEIRRDLLEPAVRCLSMSQGVDLEPPEYLAALLAFYKGQYDEAVSLAGTAFERVDWCYEAKALEGRVLTEQAFALNQEGDFPGARLTFEEAAGAFDQALAIGSSDPRVYLGACRMWDRKLHFEVWSLGEGSETTHERALELCGKVLHAEPDSFDAYCTLASAESTWSEQLMRRGDDPTESLEAGVSAATKAVDMVPDSVYALQMLGGAYWRQAQYEMMSDRDPLPYFKKAIQANERALDLDGRDAWTLNSLGSPLLDLGVYELFLEKDPRTTLTRAVECFERSFKLDPKGANAAANAGMAYSLWVEYLVRFTDKDPGEVARKGFAILGQGLEFNPRLAYIPRTQGVIHYWLARWRENRDLDAMDQIRLGEEGLLQAIEIKGQDDYAHEMLARVRLLKMKGEANPAERRRIQAQVRASLEQALRINDTNWRAAELLKSLE